MIMVSDNTAQHPDTYLQELQTTKKIAGKGSRRSGENVNLDFLNTKWKCQPPDGNVLLYFLQVGGGGELDQHDAPYFQENRNMLSVT
jgi:hypothetical protein